MNSNLPVRILIADDHPLLRAGIHTSVDAHPEMIVVGEAETGDETLSICDKTQVDILLLDLKMPGRKSVEILESLKQSHPEIKVIILTAYDDEIYLRTLLPFNVCGYVLKDEAPGNLVHAITLVKNGKQWFSPQISKKYSELQQKSNPILLTDREIQVLSLIKTGMTFDRIAEELMITHRTVRYHIEKITQKLDAKNRLEALAKAIELGILEK
jgi:DNA-binding NarL/FixJ family response regulator